MAKASGTSEAFTQVAASSDEVEFTVEHDGVVDRIKCTFEDSSLESLLVSFNTQLERLGRAVRFFELDTGGDELALLCRTPEEVEAMKRDGLFEAARLCGSFHETSSQENDWSGVISTR